jgi:hypothetical protein
MVVTPGQVILQGFHGDSVLPIEVSQTLEAVLLVVRVQGEVHAVVEFLEPLLLT